MAPFEWIVFDLDDTLMDTFGQLVQPAVRESCEAMVEAGLCSTAEEAVSYRNTLFRHSPGDDHYRLLLRQFGTRQGADAEEIYQAGHVAFFQREVEPNIVPFNSVPSMLATLQHQYPLYLVTSGHPATQQQKVEYLNLFGAFERIIYVNRREGETKHAAFTSILEETGSAPEKTLCVGDRPDREIRHGNRLGMHTFRHIHGEFRFLSAREPIEQANLEIAKIEMVLQFLNLTSGTISSL